MTTLFLATVMGWYLVIVSLLFIAYYKHITSVISDMMSNQSLFFVLGIMTLILGLLLVASHNVWIMGWPVVITLLSWMVFISAVLRLYCPAIVLKIGPSLTQHPTRIRMLGLVFFLIGGFLLFHVYYA